MIALDTAPISPAPEVSAEGRRLIDDFEMAVQARFKGAGEAGQAAADLALSAYVAGLEAEVGLLREVLNDPRSKLQDSRPYTGYDRFAVAAHRMLMKVLPRPITEAEWASIDLMKRADDVILRQRTALDAAQRGRTTEGGA